MASVLGDKDINASMEQQTQQQSTKDVKSMDYHRQMLQSKIAEEPAKQYVSPSDNIMSPCSAKISALRNKQVNKAKPKSLFAQASAKKLNGDNIFGAKDVPKP
ncbi:hypothetical protein K4F52_000803 [Lecanicillium sp. MT-2017a]|nr:hypothetical protein K4F52_000803 [Lecanicillium sp. MT-2017a]